MDDAAVVVVLTTLPEGGATEAFARTLVEERLAACVSVYAAMRSTYRWRDAVEEAGEHQVVIKTVASALDALRARFVTLHPYEVPELLVLPAAGGGEAYLAWVRQSTHA